MSLGLHIVILAPLVLVHPSSSTADTQQPNVTPTASIAAVRRQMTASTTIAKPRVAAPAVAQIDSDLPQMPERQPGAPSENVELKPIARAAGTKTEESRGGGPYYSAPQVEFFGNRLEARKVCFVVDASGSMLGLFSTVRRHLTDSISALQPDQYFAVIFFNNLQYESFSGTLARATPSAKSAAASFINSIQPSGPTNPMAAIKKAMLSRDASGEAPGIIYFLTDGFDLAPRDSDAIITEIRALRKQLAPQTRINTIGFWAQPHDCQVLQKIAEQSGGRFTAVTD